MNSDTLARARVDGRKPYKTPPEDGRRARWKIRKINVTVHEYRILRANFQVCIDQTLALFTTDTTKPK